MKLNDVICGYLQLSPIQQSVDLLLFQVEWAASYGLTPACCHTETCTVREEAVHQNAERSRFGAGPLMELSTGTLLSPGTH